MTGDLFSSTVCRDLLWRLNMAAFINTSIRRWQLTSGQPPKYFLSSWRPGNFCFWAFVRYFRSFISRSSHFSCHDHAVNWPVNLSLISYFRKPVSSLTIKLLATKASVPLTKKIHLSHSNLPTMQHMYSIVLKLQRKLFLLKFKSIKTSTKTIFAEIQKY